MKNESTYLIHHGIKGQKWGVRRKKVNSDSIDKSKKKEK